MYTNHLQLLLFIVFDFKAIYKYNKKKLTDTIQNGINYNYELVLICLIYI